MYVAKGIGIAIFYLTVLSVSEAKTETFDNAANLLDMRSKDSNIETNLAFFSKFLKILAEGVDENRGDNGTTGEEDLLYQNFQLQSYRSKSEYTFNLEEQVCTTDNDCHLANFEIAESANSPIVRSPICTNSTTDDGTRYCGCETGYCVSRSTSSATYTVYYYCGPCGRIGTQCKGDAGCTQSLAECAGGICQCENDGTFYDIYYCIIPYDGYERAMQVAIATCIFVSLCLLMATIYSVMYRQGRVHPYLMRLLARSQNQGTRESPPGDNPPKYDDIMADDARLPTYQEALKLVRQRNGIDNPSYEPDSNEQASSEEGEQKRDANETESGPPTSSSTPGHSRRSSEEDYGVDPQVSHIVSDPSTGAITKRKRKETEDRNGGASGSADTSIQIDVQLPELQPRHNRDRYFDEITEENDDKVTKL